MPRRSASPTRLNDRAAVALLVLVALAAIPFGSNRPVFWALWAFAAATGFALYWLALRRSGEEARVPFAAFRPQAALFCLVALAMLLQIVPLGVRLPVETSAGLTLAFETISVSPGDTWLAFLRWATYGLVFVLALQVGVHERRRRLIGRALALIVAAEALYALLALAMFGDTILIFAKASYLGSATGTFVNRNSLATFLSIGVVLCLSEILRQDDSGGTRERRETLAVFLVALLVIVAALLATQSRMGLFAGALGAATVVLAQRGLRLGSVVLAFGVAAVLALGYLYGEGVVDRALLVESAIAERGELYRQVVAMIAERRWTGYGAGSFAVAFPLFHDPALQPALIWDYAHSTYLSLWSGLGIVFGSLPLLLVLSLMPAAVARPASTGGGRTLPASGAAALGATVVVATHSLVDFSLEIEAVALLYTVVLATGAAPALAERARGRAPLSFRWA